MLPAAQVKFTIHLKKSYFTTENVTWHRNKLLKRMGLFKKAIYTGVRN